MMEPHTSGARRLRAAFMGSPDFAVPSLEATARVCDVPLVISQPDRRAGRGRKLVAPPVKVAAERLGLDPAVGFLHRDRPGRPSLALDLMEEFRHLADRVALTLINRGQLRPSDFADREGGSVMLDEGARKDVVVAWQNRKQEELTHPLLKQSTPLGILPLVQARLIARTVRSEIDQYPPYVAR